VAKNSKEDMNSKSKDFEIQYFCSIGKDENASNIEKEFQTNGFNG